LWNGTDRGNRIKRIGGMVLTGRTEYRVLVECTDRWKQDMEYWWNGTDRGIQNIEYWWNDTDKGKQNVEYWWNDTDRENRI